MLMSGIDILMGFSMTNKKTVYEVKSIVDNQRHVILVTPQTEWCKTKFEYLFYNMKVSNQVGSFTFIESQYSEIIDLDIDTSTYAFSRKGKFCREHFPQFFI